MEKYFKIKKSIAKRAGLDGRMRTIVDEDYLLLSEKDLKMISLTVEERLELFDGVEYVEPTSEDAEEEITTEEKEVTNG